MSLSRCGESIDEPYPANHPVDASDCKRALDSGVRRCKHSLGANIPFAAMSFLWRQLCRSARLSVYSEEGARCDSRIHARRKVVVSMLPAGWVAPFALPIPNLPDASSDELASLFLVCKQPLHLDKHERLMRVDHSRPCGQSRLVPALRRCRSEWPQVAGT